MSERGTTRTSTAKGKTATGKSRAGRSTAKATFPTRDATLGAAVRNKHGRTVTPDAARERASDTWSEFDALGDEDVERGLSHDPDAAPIDDGIWDDATVVMPVSKKPISIRIDEDVLAFFKDMGPGYQGRINAVLRSYMDAKR